MSAAVGFAGGVAAGVAELAGTRASGDGADFADAGALSGRAAETIDSMVMAAGAVGAGAGDEGADAVDMDGDFQGSSESGGMPRSCCHENPSTTLSARWGASECVRM